VFLRSYCKSKLIIGEAGICTTQAAMDAAGGFGAMLRLLDVQLTRLRYWLMLPAKCEYHDVQMNSHKKVDKKSRL